MRYLFLLLTFLLSSFTMKAGNGDEHLTLKSGFLFSRTGNLQLSYERDIDYDNSTELFGEVSQKFLHSSEPKDYYWAGGVGYKKGLKRYKNSLLKLTTEVHAGAHIKKFYFGGGIGLEYAYVFPSGVQFVLQQKNQVNFLHNSTFKHGLLVGFKIPF